MKRWNAWIFQCFLCRWWLRPEHNTVQPFIWPLAWHFWIKFGLGNTASCFWNCEQGQPRNRGAVWLLQIAFTGLALAKSVLKSLGSLIPGWGSGGGWSIASFLIKQFKWRKKTGICPIITSNLTLTWQKAHVDVLEKQDVNGFRHLPWAQKAQDEK